MPDNRPAQLPARSVKRRTVVASAWSAPVVLMALGAPAASASTTAGFDVALDGPQMGSGTVVYDADFTRIYVADEPIGWVVANHGSEPAPGGFPMSVTCDNRLWRVTAVQGQFNGSGSTGSTNLPITDRVTNGNSTTVTFTIPVDIPPHTDSYSGFFVRLETDFMAAYPHDGVTPVPTVTRWEVTPPAGDTNPADNVVQYQSYTDKGPASIWGAVVTRLAEETVKWPDGTPLNRPTRAEVTSTGPTATPDGSHLYLNTDARMSSDISVTNVTVNGAASTILTKGTSSVWQGEQLQVPFALGAPLGAGDVLRFDFVYVDNPSSTAPATPDPGQTNFNPPDSQLNQANERAQELSYFNN